MILRHERNRPVPVGRVRERTDYGKTQTALRERRDRLDTGWSALAEFPPLRGQRRDLFGGGFQQLIAPLARFFAAVRVERNTHPLRSAAQTCDAEMSPPCPVVVPDMMIRPVTLAVTQGEYFGFFGCWHSSMRTGQAVTSANGRLYDACLCPCKGFARLSDDGKPKNSPSGRHLFSGCGSAGP